MTGKAGKLVFEERYQLFAKGDWDTLLNRAKTALNRKQALKELTEQEELQRTLREAVRLTRLGELSKARQALVPIRS